VKGEKRLEEIDRLTIATSRLVGMFHDPWEELVFKNVGGQGRLFNAIEDRYLLCLTHLHGSGSPHTKISSLSLSDPFSATEIGIVSGALFDVVKDFVSIIIYCPVPLRHLARGQSRPHSTPLVDSIRCESLMRLAEREIIEIDRKQQAVDSAQPSTSSSSLAKSESSSAGVNDDQVPSAERMLELVKQIAEEARRLANTRAELQKAKKQQAELLESEKPKSTAGKKVKAQPVEVPTTSSEPTTAAEPTHKGIQKMAVPENLIPELCRSDIF
jgi:hypothetical protein